MPYTALAVRLSAAPAYVQPRLFAAPFVVGRLPECDVVVSNSGALEDLNAEVDRLWSTRLLEPGTIA